MKQKFLSLARLVAWAIGGAIFGAYITGPFFAPMVKESAKRFDSITLGIAKGCLIAVCITLLFVTLYMLWGAVRNIVRS